MLQPRLRTTATTAWLLSVVLFVIMMSSGVEMCNGSALTTTIAANERTCFYAFVDKAGEKVSLNTVQIEH